MTHQYPESLGKSYFLDHRSFYGHPWLSDKDMISCNIVYPQIWRLCCKGKNQAMADLYVSDPILILWLVIQSI